MRSRMFSFSAREAATVCGLEVRGDREFRRRTGEALSLLQPLAEFGLIQTHLAAIRQGKRSGTLRWRQEDVPRRESEAVGVADGLHRHDLDR